MKIQLERVVALAVFVVLTAFTIAAPLRASAGPTAERYALVIGNSGYGGGEEVSGVEDARMMKDYLEQLNFTVISVYDGTLVGMNQGLADLKTRIAHATIVMVFYSGHGFQLNQENYLMPIGGDVTPKTSVSLRAVQTVLTSAPREAAKLVLLDACREEKRIDVQGLAKTAPALTGTLYSFATGPNQVAASGSSDGRSPYTNAVLHSLREPGLSISGLLARVHTELVTDFGQEPTEINSGFPLNLRLREPVTVRASAHADDDLMVVLNGEIVLDTKQKAEGDLTLRAGDNQLTLLVANDKTFHNGHDWDRTEGWSYTANFKLPDDRQVPFGDREDVPFKDGAHHGKVFTVARANLHVDPATAEVTVLGRDDKVWDHETQTAERSQGILFESKVTDLPLDQIIGANAGSLGTLGPLVNVLLRTGSFLGLVVAHPERTFVVIRGNTAAKGLVQACMNQRRDDRIRDLRISFVAALTGNPRPFDAFDLGLVQCIRDVARTTANVLQEDDLRVWSNVEDRQEGPASVVAAGGS